MSNQTNLDDAVGEVLEKIEKIDKSGFQLNSVLAISNNLAEQIKTASQIDGPLSGEVLVVKDNVETIGLPATAGSLALTNTPVLNESSIAKRIKAAGGVIVASTNLSEWANIRSTQSTSGWSAVGGLTANPWKHEHSAGGSSSGTGAAVAAGLVTMGIGTETDGSITCPASLNGCVGLKPTVGLVPRDGVIPISSSQDSPGPMSQTVDQAAKLLSVIAGKDFTKLDLDQKLTFGVVKNWRSKNDLINVLFEKCLGVLVKAGHKLIELDCEDPNDSDQEAELHVLLSELKEDLNNYLNSRPGSKYPNLASIIEFNSKNKSEMEYFHQDLLEKANQGNGRDATYQKMRADNLIWAQGTLNKLLSNEIDLLLGCTYGPAWLSTLGKGDTFADATWITMAPAIAGTPIGTIPMGLVEGLPVGIGIVSRAHDELRLLSGMRMIEKALDLGVLQPNFSK